ncbi:MAG: ABC transporter ATP-binding protein [Pelagibacteraceae bacterium]|jgi:ABC-2 type transport system ATP-binding protein|nr:ABC transporter ATP-binding protein [Pelagibacteraceae bacterium]MBT3902129.1 ABC transporter ATP-binding protein [Pelagibacteraceae bacterium]MBT4645601.1 ABC transporter ATP-binding protein [Pelagibacteraceae bacterium]MBT4952323.1 ABC transporter ATP-binding protein [Pelagibacteraceae bacterium]MBT5214525.1 ABC transporter ATP-binding protein [Pelagibacteraceae bacterium]
MPDILKIKNLSKVYKNNFKALDNLSLNIQEGEIFALLGPNGAGKSTLINTVCGILNFDTGNILVNEFDIKKQYRKARSLIGIVPQELNLEAFETVWDNVNYSRGLYGKSSNYIHIEELLKELSLWDKKDSKLRELSGGMKRRVLIAKALSHEPRILFLDEPTASIDVELRKDMWEVVKRLKKKGVTIILTTHYIFEAEEIADRVGIINNGKIILVDYKDSLISKLGQKILRIELNNKIEKIPYQLEHFNLELNKDMNILTYIYNTKGQNTGITSLLTEIKNLGMQLKDISTEQSSLESIFLNLLKESENELVRS